MPIDINYDIGHIPIINTIFSNPIVCAILLTIVLMMILYLITGIDGSNAAKLTVYTLLATMFTFVLHYYTLKYNIEKQISMDASHNMVSSIHSSTVGGSDDMITPTTVNYIT